MPTPDPYVRFRIPVTPDMPFEVGDEVEAISVRYQPYSETCDGWRGTVVAVDSSRGTFSADPLPGYVGDYRYDDLEPQFFKLLTRLGNNQSTYATSPIIRKIVEEEL